MREILAGEVDAGHLDREEVRVDRIVGDIRFWTTSVTNGTVALPPVVRFGLIVEEDPAETTVTPDSTTYSLWAAPQLEQYEWMYLEQPDCLVVNGPQGEDIIGAGLREFYWHSHLDIRVKRKLGKADRLWLVMSYGNGTETSSVNNIWATPVYEAHLLRAVLVA